MSQATSVAVHRVVRLVEPTRVGSLARTQRDTTLVRALYSQLCAAITHPAKIKGTVRCPANLGISYTGTFYDGSRALATFVYGASGCQTASLTAAGQTKTTMMVGSASAAAPKLQADLAKVLGVPSLVMAQPKSGTGTRGRAAGRSGRTGRDRRQVARLVEIELAVPDPQDERLPLRLGEVELVTVGLGGVVHHVQLGLAGLVRRGRGVGGDVHLDPALFGIDAASASAG